MKNIYTLIAAISLLVLVAIFIPKSCNKVELVNNNYELQQIDSLRQEYALLKKQSTLQEVELEKAKKRKDSVVYVTKNHYIMAYDTITKDSVECLPKPYVDSLCDAFEYVLDQSDSLLLTKNSEITNLEKIVKKDSVVISNYQQNEQVLIKSVKKERRNKWLFGAGGFGLGFLTGKL